MSFKFQSGDRPLPGYTIQRGVGRGGFGEVYYATSDGGKEVALKYLRENAQIELRGVTHCLNMKDPHLVAIHDIRQNAGGEFFVVMEYVNGPSLRDLMTAESGGLGKDKAAYFLREIGKGLSYLHDRGIVHRDLKPGNIFYEDGYVKIGDYGLSKLMAASQHSGQTMSVGTLHYMAPEVGSGNYDRTIDIYAMGVMLYEMLLGRVPFSGATMGEVVMKHMTAQPEVDSLPEPFPRVIRKALAKDPADRYQTINEMMAEVFAVDDINRSVSSMDSLSLSRLAASVAKNVKAGAVAGGGDGWRGGSSNVMDVHRANGATPPVIEPGGAMGRIRDRFSPKLGEFMERPFGIPDTERFPQRERTIAGVLGLFLGPFGVHRFYTGHNGTGVLQIFMTTVTAGFAGFWGIIEGIMILCGSDFRDALGRPLLSHGKQRDPTHRSMMARGFWGFFGFVFGAAAIALTCVGTFAPPEWESMGFGQRYEINAFHIMYFGTSVGIALALFCIWKSTHRGGLASWRATVRPGLMCFALALVGAGMTLELFILPGDAQLAGIAVAAVAMTCLGLLWSLRGPSVPVRATDVYWNRSFVGVFVLFTFLFAGAATWCSLRWERENYVFRLDKPDFEARRVIERYRRYYSDDDSTREIQVATTRFNHLPIGAFFAGVMALGCLGEAVHRKQLWQRQVDGGFAAADGSGYPDSMRNSGDGGSGAGA